MALSEQEEFELLSLEREKAQFQSTPGGAAVGNPMVARQSPIPDGTGEAGAKIAGAGLLGGAAGYALQDIARVAGGAAAAHPMTARLVPLLKGIERGAQVAGRATTTAQGVIGGLGGETAGQVAEASGAAPPVIAEGARFVGGAVAPEMANFAKWVGQKALLAPALSIASKVEKESIKALVAKVQTWTGNEPVSISEQEAALLNKLTDELRGGPKSGQPAENVYGGLQAGASRAENALTAAQNARLQIAPERELSDIGGDLRGVIVGRNQSAIDARRAAFKADEEARDAIVQQREGSGQLVTQTPEYADLINSLKSALAPGKRSPDVQRGIQHILSQVEDPATSFQALDDVRRKLGDVFKGKAAEGYDAIGEAQARQLYAKISEIQKKFAGPAQERLLQQYADATEGLQMFGSRYGKKATALDRYDDSIYATDSAKLAKDFFRSREGIAALRELTGDPKLVTDRAHEFAVRELAGKSEAQVRNWMTTNRELLAAEPQLMRQVIKYADNLGAGEKAAARAPSILGKGELFKAENVRSLIEKGDTSQWQLAADAIKRDPKAAGSFAGAVRQTISARADRMTKDGRKIGELSDFFSRNVRPAVEQTGLMTKNEANEIARQIAAIENMKIPEPEKLGLARRLMLQGVGSYAAGAASRATVNAANAAAKWVPE